MEALLVLTPLALGRAVRLAEAAEVRAVRVSTAAVAEETARVGIRGRAGISAGSEATTVLYRAVSEAEYLELMRTGRFAHGPNSLGGKFFAESAGDAAKWGKALLGHGNFRIISAELRSSVADQLMRWERLDAIGPARYAELNQLDEVIIREIR
jgi:hypothetical protein